MAKIAIFLVLFVMFVLYSITVFTVGTESKVSNSVASQIIINQGKDLFQSNNCISCHQIYGLGGYLGSDLTTAWSDERRGEPYIRALLRSGGNRMPDFHFSESEINALTQYLKYIDQTATSYK